MGLEEIRRMKEQAGVPKPKKTYVIPKKSAKKIKKELSAVVNDENLDKWFDDRHKEMIGVCQCGCGQPSQKKPHINHEGKKIDYFRHCICHIYPKRIFKSVALHPLNYVERAFFGGCHTNFDEQSMDKWVGMADWDDIKMKIEAMQPYLTEEEKATKFYSHLERLVKEN